MLAFPARGAGQFSGPPAGCLGTEAPGPEIDSGDPELLFSLLLPLPTFILFFFKMYFKRIAPALAKILISFLSHMSIITSG